MQAGLKRASSSSLEGESRERLVLAIEGATHLFDGRLDELEAAATRAARWVLEAALTGPGGGAADALGPA